MLLDFRRVYDDMLVPYQKVFLLQFLLHQRLRHLHVPVTPLATLQESLSEDGSSSGCFGQRVAWGLFTWRQKDNPNGEHFFKNNSLF